MTILLIACALSGALFVLAAILMFLRHRAYRCRLSYSPDQSYQLGMVSPGVETVCVPFTNGEIVLPELAAGAASGLLEIQVSASLLGKIVEPSVELSAGEIRDIQYFERGASGARFLNISRLFGADAIGRKLRLKGYGVSCQVGVARLHVSREKIVPNDRLLVLAPHPDDAEIAAFGLYADTNATVVTITTGGASDRYLKSSAPWSQLSPSLIAAARVWDSLTIPVFGGVALERAINLCLPDGRLQEMYQSADKDFAKDNCEFSALRQMNRLPILHEKASCTWTSLIQDLSRIVEAVKPTIVVAPHPALDPHPDHLFSTFAVTQALQSMNSNFTKMFLYTVHNRRSELWPFGPARSGTSLLPIFPDDGICAASFYSHRLNVDRQNRKLVALEAMHDVREIQQPDTSGYRQAFGRISAEIRALAHGMGRFPTSYLRRAVRPDEFFFVDSVENCMVLCRRMVAQTVRSN